MTTDASIVIGVRGDTTGARVIKANLDEIGRSGDKATSSVDKLDRQMNMLNTTAGRLKGALAALGGASALNYTFNIPNLKFDSAQIVAGGNDQPVMAEMSFTAIYDSGEACALKITRDPS